MNLIQISVNIILFANYVDDPSLWSPRPQFQEYFSGNMGQASSSANTIYNKTVL